MEYKQRQVKNKKGKKATARKDAGFKRIKIRGRKRWVKTEKKAA